MRPQFSAIYSVFARMFESVQMPLQPGDKLGPYEIFAPLGTGGMAKSIRPAIRDWTASSPSRPRMSNSVNASNAKPAR